MNDPNPSPEPRQQEEPRRPQEKLPFPLQDDEGVIRVCRRHWVYLWPSIILQLVVTIVPIVALWFAFDAAGGYEGVGALIFRIAAGVYALFWAFRIFLTWYRYQNDVWVVTNQRLVDCFKPHPFDLKISTADLVNVQDMTVERSGVLRTLLDYGDIVCQTAAENQGFRLPGIPDPREVQVLIDRERDRERLRIR